MIHQNILYKLLHKQLIIVKRGNVFLNFPGQVSSVGNNVRHTPLFYKEVLSFLRPTSDNIFLDMTYGSGGHTHLILDHCPSCRIIASDRDVNSIALAKHRSVKYPHGSLTPVTSRFSQLPVHLTSLNLKQNTLEGVIIDSGISDLQRADKNRGFCYNKKGKLDLRMDALKYPGHPTASDVLQNIDEKSLLRLLRAYGSLKSHAKIVMNAIIEARYMFHKFTTVQELREVIRDGITSNPITLTQRANLLNKDPNDTSWIDDLTHQLLGQTVTALRMLVNDELNELQYGIRIASHYLKSDGILLCIIRNESEEKIVRKTLCDVDFDPLLNNDPNLLAMTPWKLMNDQKPVTLTDADRALHPRHENARMFVAKKQREMVTLAANQ